MPAAADRRRRAAIGVFALILAGCAGESSTAADPVLAEATTIAATTTLPPPTPSTTSTTTTSSTTITTTTSSTSSTTSTTTSTTSTTTTSTTTTTTTTTTLPPAPTAAPMPFIAPIDPATVPVDVEFEIGRSVNGVPITVVRRGDPGGVRIMVVGVIHGNEAAGVAIVDRLRTEPIPAGVELWLVRSMNPDGEAIGDRQNANLVDLNRNFPEKWDVLGTPGDWQYGGVGPASEPETQAMVALGTGVRPDIVLWYHQDLFRIAPGSGRNGEIRTRYAEVAGLPIVDITGGTYTGTASQWAGTVITDAGVGITVELGPTLSDDEVGRHVAAVFTVADEFW